MTAPFVPLASTAAETLSGTQHKLCAGSSLRSEAAFAGISPLSLSGNSARAPDDSTTPANGPQIELKRDGDRVTQIVVRCSCGEMIVLNCDYRG